jgi:hypothetical protein
MASQNFHAQGYLGQMDGAADYLESVSVKDKNASVPKGSDKAKAHQSMKSTANDKTHQPYHKLSRAAADGKDVINFFKLIREEEDQVITKYKVENPN